MLSKLRIDYDLVKKETFIEVIVADKSDDLKDKMLHHFMQVASHKTSRLYIHFPKDSQDNSIIHIRVEENANILREDLTYDEHMLKIDQIKEYMLSLCSNESERNGVSDFLKGFDSKASFYKLNNKPRLGNELKSENYSQ